MENAKDFLIDILTNLEKKSLEKTKIIIISSKKKWDILSIYADDTGNICIDIA